jgi:hypothetical protein
MDTKETDTEISVTADMPGLTKDDVKIGARPDMPSLLCAMPVWEWVGAGSGKEDWLNRRASMSVSATVSLCPAG